MNLPRHPEHNERSMPARRLRTRFVIGAIGLVALLAAAHLLRNTL